MLEAASFFSFNFFKSAFWRFHAAMRFRFRGAHSSGYECGQTGHIAKFCSKRSGNGGRAPRAPREAPNAAFKGASKGEKEKCSLNGSCWDVGWGKAELQAIQKLD